MVQEIIQGNLQKPSELSFEGENGILYIRRITTFSFSKRMRTQGFCRLPQYLYTRFADMFRHIFCVLKKRQSSLLGVSH